MQTKTVCLFFYIPDTGTYSVGSWVAFPFKAGWVAQPKELSEADATRPVFRLLYRSRADQARHIHDAMSFGAGRLLSCNLAASLVTSMIDAFYWFIASSEFP